MNCGEFRRWFAILLSGGDSGKWPEREYHEHLLGCPACQMILSVEEVNEAVCDVASHAACSMDELLLGEEVLRRVYRKMAIRRVIRRAPVVVAIGVVILLGVLLWRGGGAEEAPSREPPEVAVLAKTPQEFARVLANSDFKFRQAFVVKTSKALMFAFDRQNPASDQYEFLKSVALSGFEQAFSQAPLLTVSIIDENGSNLLRVTVERERLLSTDNDTRRLSGAPFCRNFRVLNDTDGRCLPQKEGRE